MQLLMVYTINRMYTILQQLFINTEYAIIDESHKKIQQSNGMYYIVDKLYTPLLQQH